MHAAVVYSNTAVVEEDNDPGHRPPSLPRWGMDDIVRATPYFFIPVCCSRDTCRLTVCSAL